MPRNVVVFLWLLKLGALVNLYFLARTFGPVAGEADLHIVLPARILFAVSAYRCLLPNRYEGNVVLHDSLLSSAVVTRALATFVEVAWIYQFSYVIRLLNVEHVGWIDLLSWLMVLQVVISQLFVWGAIATGRVSLYLYEEIGWAVIFIANTIASAFLYATVDGLGDREVLLQWNLLFGLVYLPWQLVHLRTLWGDVRHRPDANEPTRGPTRQSVARHLYRALHERNRRTDADAWGGIVGLTWMTAYWATLIPLWVHQVVRVAAA